MDYEYKKHDGSLPLVGVNTFLPKEHAGDIVTEIELIRSTEEEKGQQIENVLAYQKNRNRLAPAGKTSRVNADDGEDEVRKVRDMHGLRYLRDTARDRKNVFTHGSGERRTACRRSVLRDTTWAGVSEE